MFLIGKIVGTFGNKGDLKVTPLIEPSDYLLEFKLVYIEDLNGSKQSFKILMAKKHKNIYIFSLEGIDNMDVAEGLCDLFVYVSNIEIKDLQKNEYYYHQLQGLTVYSESGDLIGKIDHILKGGNDILVIKDEAGKEIMVPFVDKLVPEINLNEKTITINTIEGLV